VTDTLSETLVREVLKRSSGCLVLMTAVISHEDLSPSLYIVNNGEDISVSGQTYLGIGFEFLPPDRKEEGIGSATLQINNADLWLTPTIRGLSGPLYVTFALVRESNLAATPPTFVVEKSFRQMQLLNVRYNATTVRAECAYEDFLHGQTFKIRFTPSQFPGLFS
jgi:hypothetical protein